MTLFFRSGMNPYDPIERPTHRPADAPSYRLVFLLFAPFLASITAAWAWFNTDVLSHRRTDVTSTGILLTAAPEVAGYRFIPETVSPSVAKTLGTANILSGTFVRNQQTDVSRGSRIRDEDSEISNQALNVESSMLNVERSFSGKPAHLPTASLSTDAPSHRPTDAPSSDFRLDSQPPVPLKPGESGSTLNSQPLDRVTVFLATWPEGRGKPMTMLGHTPDVCWRGSGWRPIDLGQPKQNSLSVGDANIKFETRIFESPDQREREAAVWCTLVGGRPFDELGTWRDEKAIQGGYPNLVLNRLLRFKQMGRIIWERSPVRGSKQYVRFSTEMTDPWPTTFEKLRAFGSLWL